MDIKRRSIYTKIIKALLIVLGSALYAVGLEIFLIPNNVIDGGVVGISIMISHFTHFPLGILTFALNLPFLIIGYRHIGKTFTILTLIAVACYSAGVSILHPIPGLTQDVLLASVFGGIIIGVGIGLIIRSGGSTDGIEVVAIILDRKVSFSIGQIVMFFNFFILVAAGFVYGWDRAMYSLIAYAIAVKAIDLVVDGVDESKAVFIISEKYCEISEAVMARLGRGITLLDGKGAYKGEQTNILYIVVSRLEIMKLRSIVNGLDANALITIGSVEAYGKRYRKRPIH